MNRGSVLLAALSGLLVLAACGTSGSPSAAAPPPSPVAHPAVLQASAKVAGATQTVLTTPAGLTLYYLTSDVAASPKCIGGCLSHWPPLLSSPDPTLAAGLTGTLAVVQNANGSQVTYNGHLLYQFVSDLGPGDAKGEGVNAFGGTWHVATPSLTAV
jgi:predicted lipoprotein with Yx(FWY)xxD motif